MPEIIVEDGASIRAVKRVYGEASGDVNHTFEPKDICEIAEGKRADLVLAHRKGEHVHIDHVWRQGKRVF